MLGNQMLKVSGRLRRFLCVNGEQTEVVSRIPVGDPHETVRRQAKNKKTERKEENPLPQSRRQARTGREGSADAVSCKGPPFDFSELAFLQKFARLLEAFFFYS